MVPGRSMTAVFYNTRLARYLCSLLPVVHFLSPRINPSDEEHGPG
jgi:hypothetical protein